MNIDNIRQHINSLKTDKEENLKELKLLEHAKESFAYRRILNTDALIDFKIEFWEMIAEMVLLILRVAEGIKRKG